MKLTHLIEVCVYKSRKIEVANNLIRSVVINVKKNIYIHVLLISVDFPPIHRDISTKIEAEHRGGTPMACDVSTESANSLKDGGGHEQSAKYEVCRCKAAMARDLSTARAAQKSSRLD